MSHAPEFTVGQPIRAAHMNALGDLAESGVMLSPGGGMSGIGKAISGDGTDEQRLFIAQENFTKVSGTLWKGSCKHYEYDRTTSTFGAVGLALDVHAIENIALPPSNTTIFRAVFNRGSGRWERVGPPTIGRGKADADCAKGTAVTISVYLGGSSTTVVDSGENITATAVIGAIKSGKWVYFYQMDWGFEAIQAEC